MKYLIYVDLSFLSMSIFYLLGSIYSLFYGSIVFTSSLMSQTHHMMLLWNIMNGKTKRKIPVEESDLVFSVLADVRKVWKKEMEIKELRVFSD